MKKSNRLKALHTYFAVTLGNRMVKAEAPFMYCDGLCTALSDHFGTGTMEVFYWLFAPNKRQRQKLVDEGKSPTYFGSDDSHSHYGVYTDLRQTMILLMAEALSDYGTYLGYIDQAIRWNKRNHRPAIASVLIAYRGAVSDEAFKYDLVRRVRSKALSGDIGAVMSMLRPKLHNTAKEWYKDVSDAAGWSHSELMSRGHGLKKIYFFRGRTIDRSVKPRKYPK